MNMHERSHLYVYRLAIQSFRPATDSYKNRSHSGMWSRVRVDQPITLTHVLACWPRTERGRMQHGAHSLGGHFGSLIRIYEQTIKKSLASRLLRGSADLSEAVGACAKPDHSPPIRGLFTALLEIIDFGLVSAEGDVSLCSLFIELSAAVLALDLVYLHSLLNRVLLRLV